nr:hypothetical protein CFP56_18605 [Quercus suber]
MNKKEGDGDYLEVTMKQADRCIYKFQILDGVWGNNIFMKMSDSDDEVKIKLILHGIDKACYINPKSYPKIFWIKEKMFERDTQSTSSCQIVMNKKEGDGDYLEVTMKQADRCIYKFQILDGVWGNNIFMKMSDLDDEVKIKLILHGIDKACYINPKSYPKIFWIKEKMNGDYKNRII